MIRFPKKDTIIDKSFAPIYFSYLIKINILKILNINKGIVSTYQKYYITLKNINENPPILWVESPVEHSEASFHN